MVFCERSKFKKIQDEKNKKSLRFHKFDAYINNSNRGMEVVDILLLWCIKENSNQIKYRYYLDIKQK